MKDLVIISTWYLRGLKSSLDFVHIFSLVFAPKQVFPTSAPHDSSQFSSTRNRADIMTCNDNTPEQVLERGTSFR